MLRKSPFLLLLPLLLIALGGLAWGMTGFAPPGQAALPSSTPPGLPTIEIATPLPAHTPSLSPTRVPASATPPAQPTAPAVAQVSPTPFVLPEEHFIRGINGHHQYFPLGCEAAAARDWANYYKKDFNEFEFQYRLPVSDNPDLGFVGDVNSPWGQVPPYGYGVHAGPIADLLNVYGIPARAYKGLSLEQLKEMLARDKPVIVWVIGNVVGGVPYSYTDKQGNQTIVAAYEHVVIVTGYSKTSIRYMNNGKFYDSPTAVFLNSWGVLGFMAIGE
jgi:uncharacterized protein YvpB